MADLCQLWGVCSRIWVKLCLVLVPLGGLLHLIGFASPYWIKVQTSHMGWLRATQFLETIGLIAIGVALVLLFLSMFVQAFKDKKIVTIINALACIGACGSIIIGAIIYGSQDGVVDFLSWAFALCIVGAIMEGVAGAFIIMGTFATRRT